MDGKSLNITEKKLHKLKEIIPEAFTEDKIDWEKLKAALGDDIELKNERYVLNWAGKSDAFRVLQSPTTAHAVLDLNQKDSGNRKFICVQLPEKCDEKSEAYKAGYKTIAEIGKERIRRVIKTLIAAPFPLTGKGEPRLANLEALSKRGKLCGRN